MDIKFVLYFIVPFALAAAITLAGVVLLFVSLHQKKKSGQIEIEDWPIVGGKVLLGKLTNTQPSDDAKENETFVPVVEYTYVVGDVEHRGNKVFPGKSTGLTQKAAQEILDKYPVNSYVPVRYNLEDPSEAVLQSQPHHMTVVHMAGYVLTAFGVLTCCFTSFMGIIILGAIQ